jgi:perosamine synthetase
MQAGQGRAGLGWAGLGWAGQGSTAGGGRGSDGDGDGDGNGNETKKGRSDWYFLLRNSGTNALQSLYYAANFQPGDEVSHRLHKQIRKTSPTDRTKTGHIPCLYTFYTACSPAMQFGIRPIFCNARSHGSCISPAAIAAAVTLRTKAVVVTHMWGIPYDTSDCLRTVCFELFLCM